MGWFWGSSDSSNSSNASDPTKQLDPDLKKFLEKESPDGYTPRQPTVPKASLPVVQTAEPSAPQPQAQSDASTAATTDASTSNVPSQSLYQDGRYAHIWKNYEPLSSIEARSKSDQEKLSDIISAYNDRRANIGKAALENCAFEQLALSDCFKTGSWSARMTMCRAESRALDRCYTMQARFLKALGYLSVEGREEAEEERIQMHADRLYQRMLAQEKAVEAAKERGEEPPTFGSILSKENVAAAMRGQGAKPAPEDEAKLREYEHRNLVKSLDEMQGLAPKVRKEFEDRLKDMQGEERELELRAIQGEWAGAKALTRQVEQFYEEERKKRLERKEVGKETVGDTIKRWWGW